MTKVMPLEQLFMIEQKTEMVTSTIVTDINMVTAISVDDNEKNITDFADFAYDFCMYQ